MLAGSAAPSGRVHPRSALVNVCKTVALGFSLPYAEKYACVAGAAAAMKAGSGTLAYSVATLRMRISSVLLKKNSLFFFIGPPKEYPNWLRVKTDFGVPVELSWKSFEASADSRLNS